MIARTMEQLGSTVDTFGAGAVLCQVRALLI
jgi:hypothetical protein